MEMMQVVSPAGISAAKIINASPRIEDLNGKTVCEVWNGVFKGDITFPIIRKLLKAKYPGVKIIPFTEFYHLPGSDVPKHQRELAQQIVASAKEKGCDAILSGNGA
ncbi:MAG: hypothetical protein KF771_09800 [Burkholderiales bacterium]|nr:hypothetical protein [Burkholderiales bacterium]